MAKFGENHKNFNLEDLKQDDDVLDTWFSSWLWPISVFDGFESEEEVSYYYPTNDLVTAPEIMFFWVARMIMAGYEYRGELPFKNVYYTGIVRDKLRRKMSKSLGNSPDPLDLIASHGADSVRLGMLLCAPAGNDILFDESQIEQGRNFCNKIWNAFRLIKSWEGEAIELRSYERETIEWFSNRLALVIGENESHFKEFRLSNALMNLYKLVWDDFCSTYLEGVKPAYGSKISQKALLASQQFMDTLMKAIHPIMPFISEEIHQGLALDSNACVVSEYPHFEISQKGDLDMVLNAITELRGVRAQHQISPKIQFKVWLRNPLNEIETYKEMIGKLANVSWQDGEMAEGNFVMIPLKNMEMWVELEIEINKEEEIAKIEKEIAHLEGFLTGIMKKLGNEKFMSNANQDVIDREMQKKADAESKIQNLLHQKSQLS